MYNFDEVSLRRHDSLNVLVGLRCLVNHIIVLAALDARSRGDQPCLTQFTSQGSDFIAKGSRRDGERSVRDERPQTINDKRERDQASRIDKEEPHKAGAG
jgi:hypothetical protein